MLVSMNSRAFFNMGAYCTPYAKSNVPRSLVSMNMPPEKSSQPNPATRRPEPQKRDNSKNDESQRAFVDKLASKYKRQLLICEEKIESDFIESDSEDGFWNNELNIPWNLNKARHEYSNYEEVLEMVSQCSGKRDQVVESLRVTVNSMLKDHMYSIKKNKENADRAISEAKDARRELAKTKAEVQSVKDEAKKAKKAAQTARDEAKKAKDELGVARIEAEKTELTSQSKAKTAETEAQAKAEVQAARNEASRARNELEVARNEASRARNEVQVARNEASRARNELEVVRIEAAKTGLTSRSKAKTAETEAQSMMNKYQLETQRAKDEALRTRNELEVVRIEAAKTVLTSQSKAKIAETEAQSLVSEYRVEIQRAKEAAEEARSRAQIAESIATDVRKKAQEETARMKAEMEAQAEESKLEIQRVIAESQRARNDVAEIEAIHSTHGKVMQRILEDYYRREVESYEVSYDKTLLFKRAMDILTSRSGGVWTILVYAFLATIFHISNGWLSILTIAWVPTAFLLIKQVVSVHHRKSRDALSAAKQRFLKKHGTLPKKYEE